jgi:hypothetical protein
VSQKQGTDCTRLYDTISGGVSTTAATGLYRPFCKHAFTKLIESGMFVPSTNIPEPLQGNVAPAKGMPEGSVVRMETKALVPDNAAKEVVSYARYALLETLEADSSNDDVSTKGIQVMNLVVFPSNETSLPVWGVDLVSLPGNKHLLAMDVQPMIKEKNDVYSEKFKGWFDEHVDKQFEWGGEMPPEASKFFSTNALWTRLSGEEAVDIIQTKVFDAFSAHLDLYLQLLEEYQSDEEEETTNHHEEYLQYRLANDPARPMLKSLYGPEWTEEVLTKVLFPSEM